MPRPHRSPIKSESLRLEAVPVQAFVFCFLFLSSTDDFNAELKWIATDILRVFQTAERWTFLPF